MKTFNFHATGEMVARVMSCCGSLAVRYWGDTWRGLHGGIRYEDIHDGNDLLRGNCQRFIEEAVPEIGEIHPQRADFRLEEGRIVFLTPGGVSITLAPGCDNREPIWCEVDFGRESCVLATQMMAAIAISGGVPDHSLTVDGRPTMAGLVLAKLLISTCEGR